jgi:Domain of unknown function (DUF5658)
MSSIQLRRLAHIAIGAAILDVASTYLALRGAIGTEANPIAAHGMRVLGAGPLVVLDLAVRVGLVIAMVWIVRSAVRPVTRVAAVAVFIGIAAFWTLIVVSNVSMIAIASA